jgi:hypothetical protein
MKSVNHKGAQAFRNSPAGYFSAVARLQGWHLSKRTQNQNHMIHPDSYRVFATLDFMPITRDYDLCG